MNNIQEGTPSTRYYRHIRLNIQLILGARTNSNSPWTLHAQAPMRPAIHILRLTAISPARTWTAMPLSILRKTSLLPDSHNVADTQSRPALYPPTTYGMSDYRVSLPTMYPPSSTTPAAYPTYQPPHGLPAPSTSDVPALSSSPSTQNNAVMPRVLNSRPKPQCFDHGCNGRQFSTFSNLLRHQREKSGTAAKSFCPKCHAEFTRTTAMKGHMQHDKCKARRPSDTSSIPRT